MVKILNTIIAVGVLLLLAQAPSSASQGTYGGCVESARYVHSQGAQDCRNDGWTVTRRLVVTPDKVVRMSTLPTCKNEDGSRGPVPCSWNFEHRHTMRGRAYWIDLAGTTHYVRAIRTK